MLRLRVQGRKTHGHLSGLRRVHDRPAKNGHDWTEDAAFLDIITGRM